MKVGDRWGRMRCVDIAKEEERVEYEDGGFDSWNVPVYVCKCDCGNKVRVKAKEFRKREHKDCGCETLIRRRYLAGSRLGK